MFDFDYLDDSGAEGPDDSRFTNRFQDSLERRPPDLDDVRRIYQQFFDAYVAVDELAEQIVRFGFPRTSEKTAIDLTDALEHEVYGESLVRLYSALAHGDLHHSV